MDRPAIGSFVHIRIGDMGCASMLVTGLDYGRGKTDTIQGRVYDDESYQVYGIEVDGGQWHYPHNHTETSPHADNT